MKRLELTGRTFNKLYVLGFSHIENERTYWKCQCSCGISVILKGKDIKDGSNKSCGCLLYKHGDWNGGKPTTEWKTWDGMKQRCLNPNNKDYFKYGATGIKVCQRWLDEYKNFLNDMGRKPFPEYSIDRINPFQGYSPDNCRWADKSTQSKNTRKNYAKKS